MGHISRANSILLASISLKITEDFYKLNGTMIFLDFRIVAQISLAICSDIYNVYKLERYRHKIYKTRLENFSLVVFFIILIIF